VQSISFAAAHGHGFDAKINWNRAGYRTAPDALANNTAPDSIGWRNASSTVGRNSAASS
jgi:hypothetical protein